jgi:hypothetical protein
MKGSGDLCRALVKRGAVLGTLNRNMLNVFNHPVATKQLLYRSVHPHNKKKYLNVKIINCKVNHELNLLILS